MEFISIEITQKLKDTDCTLHDGWPCHTCAAQVLNDEEFVKYTHSH